MYYPSHGGNAHFQTGQVTLLGNTTPVMIPIPPRLQWLINGKNPDAKNTAVLVSAVLRITGAATDAWYGDNTIGANTNAAWDNPLTNLTGRRIVANSYVELTAPRTQVWVVGTNNNILSYDWEWN